MISPAPHPEEKKRLEAVQRLGILDTKPEERFDRITKAAIEKFQVPISTISIIDENREWYKSCQGLDIREYSRDKSFCGHALLSDVIFIVKDTLKDPLFFDNPMVTGPPYIRFYAGMALYDRKTNLPVGVFCIKDIKPRELNVSEVSDFFSLAEEAEDELNK